MSTGMELSFRYWQQYGEPAFRTYDEKLLERIAVGLAGEGSECFGYDDEISCDHDWGPGFCVWLSKADYAAHGQALQKIYDALPQCFEGQPVKKIRERIGVLEREAFFDRFIGCMPEKSTDWLLIPEYAMAVCTNGRIFHDPDGSFTAIQNRLKNIPQDVIRKKLAARCVSMMQSGQYNLPRCLRRREKLAASLALHEFIQAAAGAMLLMNGHWPPFYKWLPRTLRESCEAGAALEAGLSTLAANAEQYSCDTPELSRRIDLCCRIVAEELRARGFTQLPGCDMQQIGLDLQRQIADETLRNLPVLAG